VAATATGGGEQPTALLCARQLTKAYGRVTALDGVDLDLAEGEVLGLLGHNGAGKSTLVKVLAGDVRPDSGRLEIRGQQRDRYDPPTSLREGIVTVYQDGSLCPSLSVLENVELYTRSVPGLREVTGRRLGERFEAVLSSVFPGHDIDLRAEAGNLGPGRAQVVEVARAVLALQGSGSVLVLDEATAALGPERAADLFRWIRAHRGSGTLGVIVISHRLGEITGQTDRIAVLRNGETIFTGPSGELSKDQLVELMGGPARPPREQRTPTAAGAGGQDDVVSVRGVRCGPAKQGASLSLRAGELAGLGGLVNQGQRELLDAIFLAGTRRRRGAEVHGTVAYVSGDRAARGVFPGWSVGDNMAATVASTLSRWGFLRRRRIQEFVADWMARLDIRAADPAAGIGSLSGGNQQKVLIGRAIGSGASLLLLDDPTRGVDATTKAVIADLLLDFVAKGGSCLWYSSEPEELLVCDRVYVLLQGMVSATLEGAAITEQAVIGSSFAA
jgi:ribose transport system ATP-binding protein